MIGAEGLGIYQIALSVFSVLLTAASSGVPITVSRLITKQNALGNTAGRNAVVTAGIVSTLIFTVPAVALIFGGQKIFGLLFSDERCLAVFLIILPGLIITSIYSVMRGAFWGDKQFMPYSLIELAEDALMVALGCILVAGAAGAADGARRAAMAVFISYIFSFVVSLFWYFKKGGRLVNPKSQLKPLLSSSLPVTAMRTSTSLLNSLVAVLMPFLLVKMCNLTDSEAVSLYEGACLYGMGVWRPEYISCMEDNRAYYNAPSREAIVRRICRASGTTFNMSNFLANDKVKSDNTRTTRTPENFVPLAPPILINE